MRRPAFPRRGELAALETSTRQPAQCTRFSITWRRRCRQAVWPLKLVERLKIRCGFQFNDRVGNLGRKTYRGASYYDTDLRLQRLFKITERIRLNGSIEALNV